MTVQDRIERVVTLPVSQERAWRAITEPAELSRWFMAFTIPELRAGADFTFEYQPGMSAPGRIEAVEPPRRFAYSWHPGSAPLEETTLVEFILEEIAGGTRLTLTETGFASLPAEMYEQAFRENTGGWAEMIGNLVAYLERVGEG
jgi:uncharacterized protein YndB with AHSA1/START domain